jgi:putative NIF3 family GTP cyclohydrolase 1 type 2
LISSALQRDAGFFISADIKYHAFFEGEKKMVIADIGHFESEQFTIDLLYQVIVEKFPNFAVLKSGIVTNPVNYYI